MSTLLPISRAVPPLDAGDSLTRDEFHRRYVLDPELKKAELIDGVVYVPSPATIEHAGPHALVIFWLGLYASANPGVRISDNVTLRPGADAEVQPDAAAWRATGAASPGAEGYLYGSPELIVEVAASSASFDLHVKKRLYERAGVSEYIVWRTYDGVIDWFVLEIPASVYRLLPPRPDGRLESRIFPGLLLDAPAMLRGDYAAIVTAARG